MATPGGHRTTTSKSPRPAGPNARAPRRLETIVESRIVTSVMRINLALRAITIYSILQFGAGAQKGLSLLRAPVRLRVWCAAESTRPGRETSDRCTRGPTASIVRRKDCCDLIPATDK